MQQFLVSLYFIAFYALSSGCNKGKRVLIKTEWGIINKCCSTIFHYVGGFVDEEISYGNGR